jgi:2',3'-cyclic-nucleotide 2'-phosphodiesterase (5'-nucleotidase family)
VYKKFLKVVGLHRTKDGGQIARIVFWQIIQKTQLILCVLARIFVKYAGKIDRKVRRSALCGVAIVLFAVIASLLPITALPVFAEEAGNPPEPIAVIYHTGDIGGCLFTDETSIGADTLSTMIKSAKAENEATFLFDTGDSVQGNFFVNADEGETAVRIMNAVNYDAMCMGNHEFDYGFARLNELSQMADFPFLTQDSVVGKDSLLQSSAIIERGGVKIGVFGITTPSSRNSSNGGFERDFGTVSELINYSVAQARELRENGADIVVCLSHMGVDDTQAKDYGSAYDIAENTLGVDVIIDGHTPESEVKPQNEFTTPISSVGDAASEVGVIKFYRTNGVITTEISSISKAETLDIPPDGEVADLLETARQQVDEKALTVVGHSPVSLTDYEKPVIRSGESVLANAIADSMKWSTGADIAFCNAGNVRAPLNEGPITLGEINDILPYMNYIITAEVKGSVIRSALSHSADLYGMENGGFMQVSGVSYTIDGDKPKGERLAEVTVNGEPLDDNADYTLAVFDFIVEGGDGYDMLADSFLGRSEAHFTVVDAFIDYFTANKDFSTQKQGRIIINSASADNAENPPSSAYILWGLLIGAGVIIAVIAAIIIVKKRKT